MLEYLGERRAADRIGKATVRVLEEGKVLTYDLGGSSKTSDMGRAIAEKVAHAGSTTSARQIAAPAD